MCVHVHACMCVYLFRKGLLVQFGSHLCLCTPVFPLFMQFVEDNKDEFFRMLMSHAIGQSSGPEADFFNIADSEELNEAVEFIIEAAEVRMHACAVCVCVAGGRGALF